MSTDSVWDSALGELESLTGASATKSQRSKGLAAARDLMDASARGPLNKRLSGVLGEAVRLSKASTSNTDDNKLIRVALACATVSSRVAAPAGRSSEEADEAQGTVVGACTALATDKGGMLKAATPVGHRVEAVRAAMAVCAAKSTAVRGAITTGVSTRQPPMVPQDLIRELQALHKAAVSADSDVQRAAAAVVGTHKANRALRLGGSTGALAHMLPALVCAAADVARCGAAHLAHASSSVSSDRAMTEGQNLLDVAIPVLVSGINSGTTSTATTAAHVLASLATRAEHISKQHEQQHSSLQSRPDSVACAVLACALVRTVLQVLQTVLHPASDTVSPSTSDTKASVLLPRSETQQVIARLSSAAVAAHAAGGSGTPSSSYLSAPVNTFVAQSPESLIGAASLLPESLSSARTAAAAGAIGLTAHPVEAVGLISMTRGAVVQAEAVLLRSATPISKDATPVAAELLGAGAAWGAGSNKALAAAIAAIPADLTTEALRAAGAVDPLALRSAIASAQRALQAMAAEEVVAEAKLVPSWSGPLCAAVSATIGSGSVASCAAFLASHTKSSDAAPAASAAATPAEGVLGVLALEATMLLSSLHDPCATMLRSLLAAALVEDKAARLRCVAAAKGTDGSLRGDARLRQAAQATDAIMPLLEATPPSAAVTMLVCAAASALGNVRPATLAAAGDAAKSQRTALVALSGWLGNTLAERAARSMVTAFTLSRTIVAVATGIARGSHHDASGKPRVPTEVQQAGGLVSESVGAQLLQQDSRPAMCLLPLLEALISACRPVDGTSSGTAISPSAGTELSTACALEGGGGGPMAADTTLIRPLMRAVAAVTPICLFDISPSNVCASAPELTSRLLSVIEAASALPGVRASSLLHDVALIMTERGGEAGALAGSLQEAASTLE